MSDETYQIDKSEVLRYLGYHGGEIDEALSEKIEGAMADAQRVARPRYLYGYFNLSEDGNALGPNSAVAPLPGGDIKRHLAGCKGCYFLAATLGADVERELRKLQATDMSRAVIFDSSADDLIERVCDRAQGEIAAICKSKGLYITDRYSPGYGDLPIEMQGAFVSALDAQRRIGLTASEYHVLTPRKSVTAVIGVSESPTRPRQRDCSTCNLYETCKFRKEGGHCGR